MTGTNGIAVVVRDRRPPGLIGWLSEAAGPLGDPVELGSAVGYPTRFGQVILQPVADPFAGTEVWFPSDDLPWESHAALARSLARTLGAVILCEPDANYPDVDPFGPVWLEVSACGERLVAADD